MSRLSAMISDVLEAYPGLAAEGSDDDGFILEGAVRLDAEFNGRDRLVRDFPLKITVSPSYPIEAPIVFVLDGSLLVDYQHLMGDGSLCLGAPGETALSLQADPSLVRFMDEIVVGNLYAIEYNRIYGCLPFGERSHGADGLIEAYREMFCVDDTRSVLKLLECIHGRSYRGHLECPCGSGLMGRECHGPLVLEIVNGSSWRSVSSDYELILKALDKARDDIAELRRGRFLLQTIAQNSAHKLNR